MTPLPIYKLKDIPEALRQVAHQIEAGEVSALRCVLVLESKDGTPDYRAFGDDFTRAHAAGLCLAAQLKILL